MSLFMVQSPAATLTTMKIMERGDKREARA